jgi:hypothetical protein
MREHMSGDLRFDSVMKSIDVYGRLAFGGQCVAMMMLIAGPLLFVTAAVLPFVLWHDNRGEALLVWLGGWALAIVVTLAGVGLGVFAWRWSGDWITEWPGYAVAFGFATAGNIALGFMLTSAPIPIPASFAIAIGVVFALGCLVAGHLGGARLLPDQRQRALARRR